MVLSLDPPDLLVLANPENRRLAFFQRAVQARGWPAARVVSHADLLAGRIALEDHVRPGTWVRIESTGENHAVDCQIMTLGGIESAERMPKERGRVLHPAAWYRGFCTYLAGLERAGDHIGVRWFNPPAGIGLMFDKPRCKRVLGNLAPDTIGAFSCAEEFLSHADSCRLSRAFVKLPASSSASGVVAWRRQRATGRQVLRTSLEMRHGRGETRFYNSLRPQEYRDPGSIRRVLDFLFSQGAFAEPWIPKAGYDGMSWDLRILGIGGKAMHRVARLSRGPMTNLHLGNRRLDPADLGLSEPLWRAIEGLVESAMERLAGCLYAGLDVVVPRVAADRDPRPTVLEANAFGDLLPGIVHNGRDPWETQLDALVSRQARDG